MTARGRLALVAMSASGEACLVRDADGRTWLSSIYAVNREIAPSEVDKFVAGHDWIRVNRTFATWPHLVEYRERAANQPPPPSSSPLNRYGVQDVRDVLDETLTAETDEEREVARSLLLQILKDCTVVRQEHELHSAVVDRLDQLTDPSPALDPAVSPALAEALVRYELVAA